jgi:hypothetical protein
MGVGHSDCAPGTAGADRYARQGPTAFHDTMAILSTMKPAPQPVVVYPTAAPLQLVRRPTRSRSSGRRVDPEGVHGATPRLGRRARPGAGLAGSRRAVIEPRARVSEGGQLANEEHLRVLLQGKAAWNTWRGENPGVNADLRWIDLSEAST